MRSLFRGIQSSPVVAAVFANMTVTLRYIANLPSYDTEKPFAFNFDPGSDVPLEAHTNIRYEEHSNIELQDARALPQDELTYEAHGFRFLRHATTSPRTFVGGEAAIHQYCNAMVDFVRAEFGAEQAVCYDFRARRNGVTSSEYKASMDLTRATVAPPAFTVHVDHTQESGLGRIRRHLSPRESVKYLSGRYRARIVNVWRPLRSTLQDSPLAFCAASTVLKNDLVPADRINPDFVAEIGFLKYNPRQVWYWLSSQTPEEIAVFVQYDSEASETDTGVRACPHTAFVNPYAPENADPRESIEVRVIVFNALE